ncbi:hypothetical protein BH10ACT3_BH10ACT3_00390 [soil metagenome]
MNWLVLSIVASVVLTVLLNVAIRLWPGAADRGAERLSTWDERPRRSGVDDIDGEGRRVQVIAPWKAMLIGSIVLTVLLNVVIRLF